MSGTPDCVILIGMPAAGKSTIGVLLAKRLGKRFQDTDLTIQERAGRTLQAIVDDGGQDALRQLEESVICDLHPANEVIATGGSAVYSEAAMRHLGHFGPLVHLAASLETIRERIGDPGGRGLARREDQTLDDLYREREPLYENHADLIVDVDGVDQREVVERLVAALGVDPA